MSDPIISAANAYPPLAGKIALVTGSAQGLGEAIATALADSGCHLVIADLNAEGAAAVAARLAERTGRRSIGVGVDVTNEQSVAAAFDACSGEFGRLDICVSNAGILFSGAIDTFDVNTWRKVIDVNLVGYMIVAQHAVRLMRPQNSGVIVQINSKSGKRGSSSNSAYAASKFGGIGLTQSLALEVAQSGIRVNAVCPGNLLDSPLWVNSLYSQYAERWGITEAQVRQRYVDQVPMQRGCTYEDVIGVLLFLCSDAARYMTGQAINVTGGQVMD